jgi:DNA-directed RNA polymerase subunit beta'
MGDIVQGIPKIEEFFEARQTKEGLHFENNLHNRLKKRFRFYRKTCRYPLFIASRKSIYDIQNYIIDSIFKLYNSQGIDISDKHLEIIVRQMTSKVKVTQFWKYGTPFIPFKHPLPTELYSRHYIERYQYRKKNTRMYNVRYEPAILGITRAALENDGFISAASFQETTRILSRGAIFQKKDYLKGLKENVILGHIIPAGTAVRTYSRRFKPSQMKQVPIRKNILRLICLEYFNII